MISLNGIVLPDDLYINEYDGNFPYAQDLQYTLGGKPVISSIKLFNGNDLTLYGLENSGWITYGTVLELEQDLKNNYNNIITLVFFGKVYYLMYKLPNPFSFKPVLEKSVYLDSDYFYGEINFIKL